MTLDTHRHNTPRHMGLKHSNDTFHYQTVHSITCKTTHM